LKVEVEGSCDREYNGVVIGSIVFWSTGMDSGLEKLCSKISLSEGEKHGISIMEGEIAIVREIGGEVFSGKNRA
jgi:hypothetical protein